MPLLVAACSAIGVGGIIALAFALACRRENRPDRILGLLYHRLSTQEEYDRVEPRTETIFCMPEESFRAQLAWLRDNGYHPVTADAVLDFVEHGTPLPAKPVLITFDDGCLSVYDRALPILQEFGYPALLFVTTDPEAWVFQYGNLPQRRVTEDEIRALDEAGVTIGSHAVSHDALEAMSREEIDAELGDSKRELEQVLGKPVHYFGVPLNWYGEKVRRSAETLGFRAVFTSDNGTIHGDSDPFHLRRFIIEGSFSTEEFARNLRAGSIVQRRIINTLKRLPARIIGPKLWMPLREVLFASPLGKLFHLKALKRAVQLGLVALLLLLVIVVYAISR